MDLPIIQVADLLASANFPWIDSDDIFTSNVTPDEDTSGKTTFIRIQDATSQLGDYANNLASTISAGVEVQIFFSTQINVNIFEAKVTVLNLFQKNGWLIQRPLRPDTTDPDTGQKTVTFYIMKALKIR